MRCNHRVLSRRGSPGFASAPASNSTWMTAELPEKLADYNRQDALKANTTWFLVWINVHEAPNFLLCWSVQMKLGHSLFVLVGSEDRILLCFGRLGHLDVSDDLLSQTNATTSSGGRKLADGKLTLRKKAQNLTSDERQPCAEEAVLS